MEVYVVLYFAYDSDAEPKIEGIFGTKQQAQDAVEAAIQHNWRGDDWNFIRTGDRWTLEGSDVCYWIEQHRVVLA
jgi:hypothetical protein